MNSAGLPAIQKAKAAKTNSVLNAAAATAQARRTPASWRSTRVTLKYYGAIRRRGRGGGVGGCGWEGGAQPVQVRWSSHDSPPSLQNKSTSGRAALKIKRAGAVGDSSSRPAPPPLPPRHRAQKNRVFIFKKSKNERSCLARAAAERSLMMQKINK